MSAQNNIHDRLSKLFFDLDLNKSFRQTSLKSSLRFEYGINRGVSFRNENGGNTYSTDTSTYEADFIKNPLIESPITEGHISIRQQAQETILDKYLIVERIGLLNADDMLNEYYKLCSLFEKFGYRVKNTLIQNDNFETKSELTEIFMEQDGKKSTLSIGYRMPLKKEKEYFLSINYTNY